MLRTTQHCVCSLAGLWPVQLKNQQQTTFAKIAYCPFNVSNTFPIVFTRNPLSDAQKEVAYISYGQVPYMQKQSKQHLTCSYQHISIVPCFLFYFLFKLYTTSLLVLFRHHIGCLLFLWGFFASAIRWQNITHLSPRRSLWTKVSLNSLNRRWLRDMMWFKMQLCNPKGFRGEIKNK